MKPFALKLLAYENISPRLVLHLRAKGMDIIDVKEQSWYGKDDNFIIEQAFKSERFIVTHDSDFGTLAINNGLAFYLIIYLRLRNFKIDNVISVEGRFFNKTPSPLRGEG